jgi:uncharacterized protein (TIGR03067 family)
MGHFMKVIAVLFAFVALVVAAQADLKGIQGTWKASSGQIGKSLLPKSLVDKMVLIIKGNTYNYNEGHGPDIGALKEVGHKAPLGMDIIGTKGPNKGRSYPTIYKLDGSDLVIFYGLDGHRPKSFDEKGNLKTLYMTYHRASGPGSR